MEIKLSKNDGQLDPPPDEINSVTGEKFWYIKDFKICAQTYQEALELLPLMEDHQSFNHTFNMSVMSKRPQNVSIRRWSQEEMVAIVPLINSMETVTDENTYEFRTKYNRTLSAVTNYVLARRRELAGKRKFKRKTAAYYMRKSLMNNPNTEPVKTEPAQATGSEVKIPIKNMTVSQDANGLCLIVKF